MSSLRTWAAWSVITAVLLFSPALAFLLVMAVEILIDLLTEVGAPAPLAVAAGAFGYFLFRKKSPRPKVTPLYAGDEDALDEQAIGSSISVMGGEKTRSACDAALAEASEPSFLLVEEGGLRRTGRLKPDVALSGD
jgi:hypothetical protein